MSPAQPPLVVVVSGPSGVGKDALIARTRERTDGFAIPVTMTTRAPREGEVHGRDYIFVNPDEFANALAAGELLEHAEVYGNSYGVPKAQLREALAAGSDVIMRVDVQGAATLRQVLPGALFVFLAPPDRAALENRLRRRGDEPATLERRLAAVERELALRVDFDYVVVNVEGELERAVDEVLQIVEAERGKPERAPIVV